MIKYMQKPAQYLLTLAWLFSFGSVIYLYFQEPAEYVEPEEAAWLPHQFEKGDLYYIGFIPDQCMSCDRDIAWIRALGKAYSNEGLRVAAVSESQALSFNDISSYVDADGMIRSHYAVRSIPSAILVDANGKVLFEKVGDHIKDPDSIERVIRAQLSQNVNAENISRTLRARSTDIQRVNTNRMAMDTSSSAYGVSPN